MNNLQRLQLEVKGVELNQNEFVIYLRENDLEPFDTYKPHSSTSQKLIYQSALSVLESVANNTELMRNIKHDDMSITQFHENLMARIDQLERKIRGLKTDEQIESESNFFMLFAD